MLCKLYIYDSRRANSIAPTDHIEAWDKALSIVKKVIAAGANAGLLLDSWQYGILDESLTEWTITLSRTGR